MRTNDEAIYIFQHIPKTGGSSFWLNLAQALPRQVFIDDIYHRIMSAPEMAPHDSRENDDSIRKHCQIIISNFGALPKPKKLVISNHTPINLDDYFPAAKYISTVRNPIDRFISEVSHCRRDKPFFWHTDYSPRIDYIIIKNSYFVSYYRRYLYSVLCANSCAKSDDLKRCSVKDLPSNSELIEMIEDRFLDIICTDTNLFDSIDILELSYLFNTGYIYCNENKHIPTITNRASISKDELGFMASEGNAMFQGDLDLISEVKRWRRKHIEQNLYVELSKQMVFKQIEDIIDKNNYFIMDKIYNPLLSLFDNMHIEKMRFRCSDLRKMTEIKACINEGIFNKLHYLYLNDKNLFSFMMDSICYSIISNIDEIKKRLSCNDEMENHGNIKRQEHKKWLEKVWKRIENIIELANIRINKNKYFK